MVHVTTVVGTLTSEEEAQNQAFAYVSILVFISYISCLTASMVITVPYLNDACENLKNISQLEIIFFSITIILIIITLPILIHNIRELEKLARFITTSSFKQTQQTLKMNITICSIILCINSVFGIIINGFILSKINRLPEQCQESNITGPFRGLVIYTIVCNSIFTSIFTGFLVDRDL